MNPLIINSLIIKMTIYQDKTGKTWALNIDTNALKRVRRNVKDRNGNSVDLLYIGNGETIKNILSDPILLTDILWAILEPQAKTEQISWNAFQAAHAGNVFVEARRALAEAVGEYFPTLEGLAFREAFRKILGERDQVTKAVLEEMHRTPPETTETEKSDESGG